MLALDPRVAKLDRGKITVAATGHAQKIWGGPFVNVPAGKYTVAFLIQAAADASIPLLELTVTDGSGKRLYNSKKYRAGDLYMRNGNTWATIDFTVPGTSHTRTMEFVMTTSGGTPFSVSAMELHRQQ